MTETSPWSAQRYFIVDVEGNGAHPHAAPRPKRSAGEAPRGVLEDLGEDALGCRAHTAQYCL